MKYLAPCYILLFAILFTGCSAIQELQDRLAQAEEDMNASEQMLVDAVQDNKDAQKASDEKQTEMEAAISEGDFETATRLQSELSTLRVEATKTNSAVEQATKDLDKLGDVKTAAQGQLENASSPMDWLLGGIALIGTLIGGKGIVSAVSERQRRKITEQQQLNPIHKD